jgi:hypothetical protein
LPCIQLILYRLISIQCLAATGQVDAQEGEYLAHLLNVGNFTIAEYDGELFLPPKVDKRRARPNDGDYLVRLGILAVTFGNLEWDL